MKKILLKSLLIISLSLFINCSSSDSSSNATENPLEGFLLASGFNQVVNNSIGDDSNPASDYVTGFKFSPNENGKIKAITLKIPDGDEFVKVNIFDFATATLLHSENIAVPNANTQVTKSITALSLIKDKDYVICMYTNDAYARSKTGGSAVTYPITSGNIKIKEFLADPIIGVDNMPTGGGPTSFNGDVSFVFEKN